MARNTEVLDVPEETKPAEGAHVVEIGTSEEGPPRRESDAVAEETEGQNGEASPASASPASGSIPLRASPANGPSSSATNAPTLSMPHPKKFTHSNINKKFLEKTSSTSPSGQISSTSVTAKIGSSIQKPPLQTAPSHSRLVTAKLTATAQSSTTTGPGWSRPPSSVSSVAPTPSSATNSKPLPLSTPTTNHSGSQPSAVGKVIQPQPRGASEIFVGVVKKDNGSKPVWGNTKVAAAVVAKLDAVANDFPTAAEVAQGRTSKMLEKKEADEAAAAQKQAVAAEEDTFRGVHLNPNAHHWDEMEEDDDNFLGGVIEFGDGRQYKIQQTEAPQQSPPPHVKPEVTLDGEADPTKQMATSLPEQPVSKEERFADDFDRSWPRSRITTTFPHNQREQYSNGAPSSASSPSVHSPQEASRVLFNERSNRLEPYSNTHPPLRQSGSELRGVRDAPPHVHTQGVQLLQKGLGGSEFHFDGSSHSRTVGDRSGLPATSPMENSRFRDRDPPRRDSTLPSPGLARTSSQGFSPRMKDNYNPYGMPSPISGPGRDAEDRPRRTSTMGPPPLPMPSPRDVGRQLPPHLSSMRPPPSVSSRTNTLPESRPPELNRLLVEPSSTTASIHAPIQSPLSSHTPISPIDSEKPLPSSPMPLVDLEKVRKAAMQSAAERAKLRRKQEEEEREREKERARRKAAEIEEKMKAEQEQRVPPDPPAAAITEAQVIEVIEGAVQIVKTTVPDISAAESASEFSQPPPSAKSPFAREPSSKGAPRSAQNRRTSFPASAIGTDVSPATDVDSWRNKAIPRASHPRPDSSSAHIPLTPVPPPLLAEVESFDLDSAEDIEIVDFSELGKLVGTEGVPQTVVTEEPPRLHARPPRAVATDFFDDNVPVTHEHEHHPRSDEGSWRRKPVHSLDQTTDGHDAAGASAPRETLRVQIITSDTSKSAGSSPLVSSHSLYSSNHKQSEESPRLHGGAPQTGLPHHGHGPQRSPLTPFYREAPMSTLNDVMSRIKGALDSMHPKPEPSPKPQKWLPPALRQTRADHESMPTEVFDSTGLEPPRSPRPAWNVYNVRLPRVSRPYAPVAKHQLQLSQSPSFSWSGVFTWEPPLAGNTPSDVLFRKPLLNKGRARYYVVIPKSRQFPLKLAKEDGPGPVVNLPSKPVSSRTNNSGMRHPDATSNLHKSALSPVRGQRIDGAHISSALDTVSRSPPPEAPSASNHAASLPKSEATSSQAQPVSDVSTKSRSQPKMPVGSDVAFYRDARVDDATQQTTSVNFIVTSELEDDRPSDFNGMRSGDASSMKSVSIAAPSDKFSLSTGSSSSSKMQTTAGTYVPTLVDSIVASDKSHLPLDRAVITPPPHTSSQRTKSPRAFPVKESPSRAPDPEHLKALWSQASNQAELPSVNSLEGIADDLTTVPFTLQDVKSEDGETPPPSGSGPPSRMSLHEVTRAFQQVPPPSVTSPPLRGNMLPTLASPPNGAVSRPNFAYAPPLSAPSVRPVYGYPSPMLSHTPSPTVMYPHMAPSPVPRPMVVNGPSSPYTQPIWMHMHGPNPQAPNAMMRPMASPYPAQLMPYPTPGAPVPVYGGLPPNMQNPSTQGSNGVQNRAPGVPMMSPVMQHAHPSHPIPMYASSPVMLHSPSMVPVPPGPSYPGVPNRGQLRGPFDHAPGHPPGSASTSHPPPQSSPYVIAPNSYGRPAW